MIGERVTFRHVPTGDVRSGVVAGFSPDYPNVVFVKLNIDGRVVAVHSDNIIGTA